MAVTTSGDLAPAVRQDLAMRMLALPTPNLIHKTFAMKDVLEAKHGDTKRYRRYAKFATATAPLGPSAAPVAGKTLSATDLDAKIDWYGDWTGVSEQVVLANQERVLNEAALILGLQLRETEDELIRDMLSSTVSQINCVNGSNGSVPTEWTQEDSVAVSTALIQNSASMFLSGIKGEDRFGTAPVRNAFVALATARLIPELDSAEDFTASANYPAQEYVMDGEWGTVRNVRYFVSPLGSVSNTASSTGLDVANVFIAGKESFACIKQNGASAEFIYNPPYLSDELRQSVSLGWKMAQVPRVLNNAWIMNLRCSLAA